MSMGLSASDQPQNHPYSTLHSAFLTFDEILGEKGGGSTKAFLLITTGIAVV